MINFVRSVVVMMMIGMGMTLPSSRCPIEFSTLGVLNDLGLMAEVVSWDNSDNVMGVCGEYIQVYEKHGDYDTRLRIYENVKTNHTVFSFRPTQNSKEGGDIHVDRKLSACRYMNESCFGMVNERFQEAFITLIQDLDDNFFEMIHGNNVSIVGHSLGGSFQLMMGIYLYNMYNITPKYMLGLAGPFVGDVVFTNTYQKSLREVMGENWWQIETVDISNPSNFDGTVEQYNVNNDDGGGFPTIVWDPFPHIITKPKEDNTKTPIYIQKNVICGFYIHPLTESYGMHDLKNYRLMLGGLSCE